MFGLEKSNAWEADQDALAVLATLANFPFERPAAGRVPPRTRGAVMDAFPEVRVIVDGQERPCERPEGWEEQKPFSSGKKERHAVKNQIARTPEGQIVAVGETVPGSTHDLSAFRDDGLLGRLGEGGKAMGDKAYIGANAGRPDEPMGVPMKKPRGGELTEERKEANRKIGRARVVVEHAMAQLNQFRVLRQVLRSDLERHARAIRVVAVLVARRIRIVPPKRYAAA